jgi:hypothetical protein
MAPNPSAPVRDQSSARTASTDRRDRKQLIRRSSATISGHQGRSHLAEGIASSSSDAHQRQSVAIKGDRTWPKGSQAACEELSIDGGVARQSVRGRHEERATPS